MADLQNLKTMRVDQEDGIMTITLNRPEKLNAFTVGMMHDWFAVLDAADADDAVRALIVTGAGRAFCAGADLSSGAETFDPNAAKAAEVASGRSDSGDSNAPAVRRDEGGRMRCCPGPARSRAKLRTRPALFRSPWRGR